MQKINSRHYLEFIFYIFISFKAFILSSKSGCEESKAIIPVLFLVEIFIAAKFESSDDAIDCIFFNASNQAIIFSFHKNSALQASALNSLCLENAIAINDANIQKMICNRILTKK